MDPTQIHCFGTKKQTKVLLVDKSRKMSIFIILVGPNFICRLARLLLLCFGIGGSPCFKVADRFVFLDFIFQKFYKICVLQGR